ncbi:MAG: response regulator transcription factor [Pseudonocardiales bacterium]
MTGEKGRDRVVLFDDSPNHNRWLSGDLVQAGIAVVGIAETAAEMRELVTTVRFDVAILDVHVGSGEDLTGLRMGLWLKAQLPDIGVLMLTNFDSELCALRLLDGNTTGVGYLIKDRVPHTREIVRAIALIKEGRNVLDAKIKAALLPLRGRNRLGEDLTAIETETLRLVVEGHTNKAIADIFDLSDKTIAMRCTTIFDKLGFADRKGLASATGASPRLFITSRISRSTDASGRPRPLTGRRRERANFGKRLVVHDDPVEQALLVTGRGRCPSTGSAAVRPACARRTRSRRAGPRRRGPRR